MKKQQRTRSKYRSAESHIDLNKCWRCTMSNPTMVEDVRPTHCQWCGYSLSRHITCGKGAFTPPTIDEFHGVQRLKDEDDDDE